MPQTNTIRIISLVALIIGFSIGAVILLSSGVATANSSTLTFNSQDSLGNSVFVAEYGLGDEGDAIAVFNGDEQIGRVVNIDNTGEDLVVELDEEITVSQNIDLTVSVVDTDGATDTRLLNETATVRALKPDVELNDNTTVNTIWSGNVLVLNGNFSAGSDYQIRDVADDSSNSFTVGSLAREVRAVRDDQIIVRTPLIDDGTYVVENDANQFSSNEVVEESLSEGDFFAFELDSQTLEVSNVTKNVVEGGDIAVDEIISNRADYNLTVTARTGVGTETTLTTFENLGDFEQDLDIPISGELGVDDYTLFFNVTDTTATDSTEITVHPDIEENNLTYSFEIPNDGETYSIGIPGEVSGTLADMIDPNAEGYSVFTFNNGDWEPVTNFDAVELEPLDAITIATEGASSQQDAFTFQMEFEEQSSTVVPPQRSLDAGWNFVAASQLGDADVVFNIDEAFLVLDRFKSPTSDQVQTVPAFNNHFINTDKNTVTPFKGYFLFVEDDTVLPGVLSGFETRSDIADQLNLTSFSK
jgi:hypothetical protein